VLDEEALLVEVGVDEPAGDVVRRAAADGSGGRVVDVQATDLHDQPVGRPVQRDVGLAEHGDTEREVDTMPEAGYVEVRSSQDNPVTAADVAQALLTAQVRALCVFDRLEWSVAEV
jgi:hypothetical protein